MALLQHLIYKLFQVQLQEANHNSIPHKYYHL
nr:MAG TPA: hypothetical protein [Bacteriophage sp.]